MTHVEIINSVGDAQQIDFSSYLNFSHMIYLNCVRPEGFLPSKESEQIFITPSALPSEYQIVYRSFLRNYMMSRTIPPLYYITCWNESQPPQMIAHFLLVESSKEVVLSMLKKKSDETHALEQQQQQGDMEMQQ